MISLCNESDFEAIASIINEAAQAYRGIIPQDRLEDPYMSRQKLRSEIDEGVVFWGFRQAGDLAGVMGIQPVQDVSLIRHAYVRTVHQKQGIGAHLLKHLRLLASGPVLVGTWADAIWAIRFYEQYGFEKVGHDDKVRLLEKYWNVPDRQIETSVVLADQNWRGRTHLVSARLP